MLDLDLSFTVNELDIVAQSIHDETLIINLNSGAYYTTNETGDEIWRLLAQGVKVSQVIDNLRLRYPNAGSPLTDQVVDFIEQLRREDLLEDGGAAGSAAVELPGPSEREFITPAIEKYTDFEDLLMLDPIHQVNEVKGWPSPKPSE